MNTKNKEPKEGCLPLLSIGLIFFFGGLTVTLIQLSGEAKTGGLLLWILAAFLLISGGAALFGVWRRGKQIKAAGPVVRPEYHVPVEQPPVNSGEVRCPSCGHAFVPPRVMLVTQAVTQRYGPNPAQCPQCKHIWSRK